MSDLFNAACDVVLQSEGKFTDDPRDKGNWTGGAVGVGVLKGTHHGISAAAYPQLDIRTLTAEQARTIYQRDYWAACRCHELPTELALLVFDSAVNNGRGNAVRFLQRAAKVADDGAFGPITMAAVLSRNDRWALAAEFQRQRTDFMRLLSTWSVYGGGWAIRLAMLPCHAASLVQRFG